MKGQLLNDYVQNAATKRCHTLLYNCEVPMKAKLFSTHARNASKYQRNTVQMSKNTHVLIFSIHFRFKETENS